MGGYGDIKTKKFIRLLKWLANHKGIELANAGRHNYKVTAISTNESYPIPGSHRYINKHIVKDFKEWLVKRDICTEDEFDKKI